MEWRNEAQTRFLLANAADVNATTPDGTTALMLAASSARSETISLLQKQGARVNACDNNGETALMYNVEGKTDDLETLRLLLKLGADAGVKSKTGKTALNIAEKEHQSNSIRLLKHGADVNVRDGEGKTLL